LWQDYIRFGELFGMPREAAPPTVSALDAWWAEQLGSERTFLTDEARAVGRSIGFRLPAPALARLPLRGGSLVLAGSLPPVGREASGSSWSAADQLAFDVLPRPTRAGRPLVPARVRRGSCLPFYDLVAKTERANLRAGKASFAV